MDDIELKKCTLKETIRFEIALILRDKVNDYQLVFPDQNPPCFVLSVGDQTFCPEILVGQLGSYIKYIENKSNERSFVFEMILENVELIDEIDEIENFETSETIDEPILEVKQNESIVEQIPFKTRFKNIGYRVLYMFIFPLFLAWLCYNYVNIDFQNGSLHFVVQT